MTKNIDLDEKFTKFSKEASSYIDRKKREKEKKDYKKKHGRDKFAFVGKSMDRKHSMGIAAEFDPKVDEGIMDTAGFHNYPKRNKVGDEIEKIASKGGTDKFNLSKVASELQKGRIPHKFIKKLSSKSKKAVHDIMKDFGWKELPEDEEIEEKFEKEARSYIDAKKKEKEKKDYKKKYGREPFSFSGKHMSRKHSMGIAAEFDPELDEGYKDLPPHLQKLIKKIEKKQKDWNKQNPNAKIKTLVYNPDTGKPDIEV